MPKYYTDEKHAQIVIALLKEHGIRKIVVSPGATNIPIAASVQYDPFFEVYSSVDERSAAYLACGLSEESGETVVISCTGATASRNYLPGLTEAYYRKLPIVALTSFNGNMSIGQLLPQNIDRTVIQKDVATISVQLPIVKDEQDFKYCSYLTNKALLETKRNGGGPVHINLTTTYLGTFNTEKLPSVKKLERFDYTSSLPSLENKKIAIFIGSHKKFTSEEVKAIDNFCKCRQAVVLCDHTSSYKGEYRVLSALVSSNLSKLNSNWSLMKPDVVIHIGEVSGDYPSTRFLEESTEVWRVSEDGEIRDRGGKLKYIYEGTEISFFNKFQASNERNLLFTAWKNFDQLLRNEIPKLPFSNLSIAEHLHNKIPKNSHLHLAILNSLRCWNYFEIDKSIDSTANVGGFGIDGCMSTLIGASLVNKERLYFGVIGDLAFYYDINVIANRHVGNNLRILLINNGCGTEFNNTSSIGAQFGESSNEYIAAGGHFGSGESNEETVLPPDTRRERSLAKAWCENLNVKYLSAINEQEFSSNIEEFISSSSTSSIIFECFTTSENESKAIDMISMLQTTKVEKAYKKVRGLIPESAKTLARNILS